MIQLNNTTSNDIKYPKISGVKSCDMKNFLFLQVKGLTSLEVARQRQASRAQLHLGLPAQPQGPLPHSAHMAVGQLQPSRLPQAPHSEHRIGQDRHEGLLGVQPAVNALGKRLGSISETPQGQLQGAPGQQARAKLEAIRNELGEFHSEVNHCS